MKNIKFLIAFVLAATFFGCSDDDNSLSDLENASAPSNITALFTITQDNTGLVRILPGGESVTKFDVYFGDGTAEPAMVLPGNAVTHTYAEGVYNVKIIGTNVNGKTAEYNHELTVSFVQPENVQVAVTGVTGNSLGINVSATADYEAYFTVLYGDDPAAVPVEFNEGQTVTHNYAAPGTYTITVTAYSGGAASTTVTETVTVTNPLLLPIDFESTTLNYAFFDFGGSVASVVDNPAVGGINTSTKVGRVIKTAGAETWAGSGLTLDAPIDFATLKYFRVKVWAPAAGIPVLLKVENLTDGNINHEVTQTTTTAGWQYLTYNFTGVNTGNSYHKIILFFNFGNWGGGESYYFDDITLFAGDAGVGFPLTFENNSLNYIFNNFGGAVGSKVANPHQGTGNPSATVGQLVKNNGAEMWAGIAMPMAGPIDFSAQQKVKMKIWSPAAGKTILLKFENIGNSAINIERQTTTTVANAWEEITFDFAGIVNSNNYGMVVLFCDFGATGNGATYYFDDIQLTN
ncbi:hypothetical protein LRS05_11935 [Flavobacterium sp. J372]|uniref:PKD domain-containing protein n=1 Tax=Flavobacterium sp. J372 TaxID=2898436 RepID=UPI00215128F7|nr:PKD domain-containing protein [Flavobacterium sp. J372]MCR5862803.1 hypothetical protein [Flavobacterium sp. J372]